MGRLCGYRHARDAMHAYSSDLRQRVLADRDRGLTTRVVATTYAVSESRVRRLKQRRRDTGETAPRVPGPRRPPRLEAHRDRLRELVAAQPDATLPELPDQLAGPPPGGVARPTRRGRRLAGRGERAPPLGLGGKKKVPGAAEQAGREVRPRRDRWGAGGAAWAPRRLVFPDETGASSNRARRYG